MKSKKISFAITAIVVIITVIISTQAYANPPDDMVLEYNVSASELDVTITHPTFDPNTHYIYKVDIDINGELYLSELYTSQPTSDPFTYTYTVVANAGDEISVTAFCSLFGDLTKSLIVPNENAPDAPKITGPSSGKTGETYTYTFVTTDPNGDDVYYYIEWGDGSNTGWIGPFASGEEITQDHSWSSRGSYTITAKAKDTDDNEGLPGNLIINMPRGRYTFSNIFLRYIELFLSRFPFLYSIIF